LRRVAAELVPHERVATCGRFIVPGEDHVRVQYAEETQSAYFENLETCGSVWHCPVDSAKVNAERRAELGRLIETAEAQGLHVYMATFTLQHAPEDPLEDLVSALKDALRRVKRGAPWVRFRERWGVVGYVSAFEVLDGRHGWHPHVHLMIAADHLPGPSEVTRMRAWLHERYGRFLRKHHGRYVSPRYGVDVRTGAEVVNYLTKWGLDTELTGRELKNGHGRTPFQLLAAYADGDKRAGARFREYAEAVKGLHQLQGLRRLQRELGIDPEADPLEGEEIEAVTLAALSRTQWATVVKAHAQGDLLRVAAEGDPDLVWAFLEILGVVRAPEWERERIQATAATGALSDSLLIREAEERMAEGSYLEATA
jgi:hypothetical protein